MTRKEFSDSKNRQTAGAILAQPGENPLTGGAPRDDTLFVVWAEGPCNAKFNNSPHPSFLRNHFPPVPFRQLARDMTQASSSPTDPLALVGRHCLFILEEMGRIALFLAHAFAKMFALPLRAGEVLQQVHFIGLKSLFIVSLTALFTGMVLGLQGYYTLVKFGGEAALGTVVALSVIRELGPVLTALMVTGRAGSSMAAEIGIMRISEQIDALDTMDIDPVHFLASPRLAASIISFPLLTAIFDVVGIIGGYLTGVVLLGVNSGIYLGRMEAAVGMEDVSGGFIKAATFGIIVATVCCYQGYMTHTRREGFGARGVSYSTTTAVVMSAVLIFAFDYVLTSVLL